MPLEGTICCQTGQPRSFEECKCQARAGDCKHPLPLLANMEKQRYLRQDVGISASTLGGCPRQYILSTLYDYYENPEDYYARWFGTFTHAAVEMDGPYTGISQEIRYYRKIEVDGEEFEISGQPDWIDWKEGRIEDYKMSGYKPKEARREHIAQLNVYRWLICGDDPLFEPRVLRVNYLHPGKSSRHTEYEVMIWTDEAVEEYIRAGLRPYLHFQNTGRWEDVGVMGVDHAWRIKYCPFARECNEGSCCMVVIEEAPAA